MSVTWAALRSAATSVQANAALIIHSVQVICLACQLSAGRVMAV